MPIQIPRISVNQEEPLHAPRIQSQGIDAVTPEAKQLGALEGVAKDAIRLQVEIGHQQADTTATNKANEYLLWRKKKLYGDPDTGEIGLTSITGKDPQELYKQFDEDQQKKLDELSAPGKNENWSNETQTLVNRRLSRHYTEAQIETLTQYSHQKRKYDDDISDTNVGLAQQGMYNASGFIVPGDKTSFGQLDAKIANIRNTRISQALRYFGAADDPNGETVYNDGSGKRSVNLTPTTKYQIAEDIAKGLGAVTKNLIDSKALDKAKALKEWADEHGYLDTVSMGKIQDQLAKAQRKHEAYEYADEALKKGSGVLDQIDDPELRHDARKIYGEEQRYKETEKARKSKSNYDALANYVGSTMRGPQPFKGANDLENDPQFAKMIDNVTDAKQRQAIYHMVDQPKDSSPAARARIVDLFMGKDPNANIKDLNPTDFNIYLSGLSKPDQRKYESLYEKLKMPSNAQLETQVRLFGKELDDQAIGAGLLRKLPNSQFLVASDQITEKLWKKELLDSIAEQPVMGPKERSDYVAKFIADKKAGQAFQPLQPKRFNGTAKVQATNPPQDAPKPDVSNVYGNLTPAARLSFILQYKKANNGMVPNEKQLIDFIGKQTGNK